MSKTDIIRTHTMGYENHFTLPWTESTGVPEVWGVWSIKTATMQLVEDGVVTSKTQKTSAATITPPPSLTGTSLIGSGTERISGNPTSMGMARPTGKVAPWVLGVVVGAGAYFGI